MNEQIEFYLPLGLNIDGNIHRKGKMHYTTTLDELNVQEAEDVYMNSRYRDILLLASVIDQIGDITNVTKETIMELYEVDFLYLQFLYRQINGTSALTKTKCPNCNEEFNFNLKELFSEPLSIR